MRLAAQAQARAVAEGIALKISEVRPAMCVVGMLTIAPLALGAAVAGCSSGSPAGRAGTSCGGTRTGINVPVTITVAKGSVDCATAMRVERAYAASIREGALHGNGGGAPVVVDGWTCQAYPTPEVLRTGVASECHTASAELLAVLALPSAPATSGS